MSLLSEKLDNIEVATKNPEPKEPPKEVIQETGNPLETPVAIKIKQNDSDNKPEDPIKAHCKQFLQKYKTLILLGVLIAITHTAATFIRIYSVALLLYTISTLLIFLLLGKIYTHVSENNPIKYLKPAIITFAVLVGASALPLYIPMGFVHHASEDHVIEADTIYITYNPDCPYCEASYSNMVKAATLYSKQYGKRVQLVNVNDDNIDKMSKLQKELYDTQEYFGSMFRLTHGGDIEVPYIAADDKENPIARSTADIYRLIMKVHNEDAPKKYKFRHRH